MKAHAGIHRNEIADRLAKEASQTYQVTYSWIQNSAIKMDAQKESIRKWQNQWREKKKAAITKEFFQA